MVRVGLGFDSLYRGRYQGIWSHVKLVIVLKRFREGKRKTKLRLGIDVMS